MGKVRLGLNLFPCASKNVCFFIGKYSRILTLIVFLKMQCQTASAKEKNLPGPGYFGRARKSNNVYKFDKHFKLSSLQNLKTDLYALHTSLVHQDTLRNKVIHL